MKVDFGPVPRIAAGGCRYLVALIVLFAPAVGMAQLVPDQTFGVGGKVTTPIVSFTNEGAKALAVDSQNRVLVAYSGYDSTGISRHLADGSLNSSFGDNGVRRLDFGASDLLVQADGKIIVVGTRATGGVLTEDWQVIRLLTDGTLDSSFASGGVLTVD